MANALKQGYMQVYTGDGKGKTTAALGLALRAAGAGMRVCIIQFGKAGKFSEHKALERFADCITVCQFGTGKFIMDKPSDDDIRLARQGLQKAIEAIGRGEYDLVILDEATTALSRNLFDSKELLAALAKRHEGVEIVITGRKAPRELLDCADLVTEMKEVKHYFSKGVRARKGIEK